MLTLVVFGCYAGDQPTKTELLYNGQRFLVPSQASVIAPLGGDEDIFILRYGPDKGKKYLAFSDIAADNSVDYGCEASVFYQAVFTASEAASCNQDVLNAFDKMFIQQREAGIWTGDKLTVYFSIDSGQSFLFVFDKTGKAIKIDTDFLSKPDLKEIVSTAL